MLMSRGTKAKRLILLYIFSFCSHLANNTISLFAVQKTTSSYFGPKYYKFSNCSCSSRGHSAQNLLLLSSRLKAPVQETAISNYWPWNYMLDPKIQKIPLSWRLQAPVPVQYNKSSFMSRRPDPFATLQFPGFCRSSCCCSGDYNLDR